MKEKLSSLKNDKQKRFKMETKKQKSQLRMEEESETIEQKSQLPTEKGSESTKPASVIFTFYKFLEFLGMLYNSI